MNKYTFEFNTTGRKGVLPNSPEKEGEFTLRFEKIEVSVTEETAEYAIQKVVKLLEDVYKIYEERKHYTCYLEIKKIEVV